MHKMLLCLVPKTYSLDQSTLWPILRPFSLPVPLQPSEPRCLPFPGLHPFTLSRWLGSCCNHLKCPSHTLCRKWPNSNTSSKWNPSGTSVSHPPSSAFLPPRPASHSQFSPSALRRWLGRGSPHIGGTALTLFALI